jgi:tetratricopeptide (TPR) repeat protein
MTLMRAGPATAPLRLLLRRLPALGMVMAFCVLAGCASQDEQPIGKLPDGTVSILLTHLKRIGEDGQRRIRDLEFRKDWDGLGKLAEDNIPVNRHNPDWWFVAGYAYSRGGKHGLAVERFGEHVRLAPDDLLGSNMLAQAYRDAGQPARAVQVLNNAHLVRDGTSSTYYLLGECYSDLNRYLPAVAAYREAVKLDPNFAQGWLGLGRSSAALGQKPDYDQALGALRKLDPALAKQLAAIKPRER